MMKKIFLISVILLMSPAYAQTQTQPPQAAPAQTTPAAQPVTPYTDSAYCSRIYEMPSEKLFHLTMAAITENKYAVNEAQTKEGYILFAAGNKEFLATIVNIDDKSSLLKIAPTDNSYYFSQFIVNNIFVYINQNAVSEPVVFIKGK